MPKWSWERVFLINQPTINLATTFLLPPSSLSLMTTSSCDLIGTFLSQRPPNPHRHHPPTSGKIERGNSKKTISTRGICGARRERRMELLHLLGGLRVSLWPCRVSGMLTVQLSQSSGG